MEFIPSRLWDVTFKLLSNWFVFHFVIKRNKFFKVNIEPLFASDNVNIPLSLLLKKNHSFNTYMNEIPN